jgi:preprotein translocase subunit YajC
MMTQYQTLLLLIVIFIIPIILIHYWVIKENKKADEAYERKLRDIEKRYGVKL